MGIEIRLDENLGFYCGILLVVVIGKLWLVQDMGYWEIFWGVMRNIY
jgi:hypothetical protein